MAGVSSKIETLTIAGILAKLPILILGNYKVTIVPVAITFSNPYTIKNDPVISELICKLLYWFNPLPAYVYKSHLILLPVNPATMQGYYL